MPDGLIRVDVAAVDQVNNIGFFEHGVHRVEARLSCTVGGTTIYTPWVVNHVVVIEDSTALDFREQADEGITFELHGLETPYHPYPYLEQNSKRAVLRKEFASASYPEGYYVFTVQAQDVLGNVSKKTVNLEITGDMKAGLADVFNVPNPVGKKGTTFYFKNLAVDRESTVDIFIYNQHGRLVKVLKDAVSGITHWDGKDNHGRLLANGLYHYVVRSEVTASDGFKKKTWTKKQKLLISR